MIDTIEGIAKLDLETVKTDNYFIKDRNDKRLSSYNFIDSDRKCKLTIAISKNENPTATIARIFKDYGNGNKELTPVLYYK